MIKAEFYRMVIIWGLLPRKLLIDKITFLKSLLSTERDNCYVVENFTKWTSDSGKVKDNRSLKKDDFLKEFLCSNREVTSAEFEFFEQLSNFKDKSWIVRLQNKQQEFIKLHYEMKKNLLASEFKDIEIGGRKFTELVKTLPIFELEAKSEKKIMYPLNLHLVM